MRPLGQHLLHSTSSRSFHVSERFLETYHDSLLPSFFSTIRELKIAHEQRRARQRDLLLRCKSLAPRVRAVLRQIFTVPSLAVLEMLVEMPPDESLAKLEELVYLSNPWPRLWFPVPE